MLCSEFVMSKKMKMYLNFALALGSTWREYSNLHIYKYSISKQNCQLQFKLVSHKNICLLCLSVKVYN